MSAVLSAYEALKQRLTYHPETWLVTGSAGFIGSHLTKTLLELGQTVVGLDNLATGSRRNLELVAAEVGADAHKRFTFIEGDIRDLDACRAACTNARFVLHQAALGSVPRSIADPIRTHEANISGFLNMLVAARDAGAERFVYASSSSVYGDHPVLPKVEPNLGRTLSPYATTKLVNELYARNFWDLYQLEAVGLRYFNVFGPRQDPEGAYAAVIPKWIAAVQRGEPCRINGDGETSRDFCFVDNAVQANLLAATAQGDGIAGEAFNVACEARTTLNEVYRMIRGAVAARQPSMKLMDPEYGPERAGDVRHSLADVGRARARLGYEPEVQVADGLERTVGWFLSW